MEDVFYLFIFLSRLFSVCFYYVPLLSVYVKLVYLIFIVHDVHIPAILEYVVLELDKLLGLPHLRPLAHPLDLLRPGVDHEALRGQVGVQEAPEYHYLALVHRERAQLRTLCVTAHARQVNVLPVGRTAEVMRGREV